MFDTKLLPIRSNTAGKEHKKAYSISQVELNNIIKENIVSKRKNPFWVPHKNSDLFVVKDIIKEEKHQHRKRKDLAEAYHKSNINTYYHRKQLTDGYSPEKGKNSKENNKRSEEATMMNHANTVRDGGFYLTEAKIDPSATTRILKEIVDERKKNDEKEQEADRVKNKLVREKVHILASKEDSSVKKFIDKTREIILMKYSTKVKQERVIRLNETYDNEVEQFRDRIYTLEQSKDLFKNEFFIRYEDYVKNLRDQRDREKIDVNKLIDTKNELEGKVKQLENKIAKNKEKITQFMEYKKFMMQIKEHNINPPDLSLNDSSAAIEKDQSQSSIIKSITNLTKNKKSKLGKSVEKLGTVKQNDITLEREKSSTSLIQSSNNRIFETPNDLIEELKKLEQENLNLLSILNTAFNNVNEAEIEVEKFTKKETEEFSGILKEVSKKEEEYKRVKNRNDTLLAEIAFLSKSLNVVNTSDPDLMQKQENAEKLFNKIYKLYENCYENYLIIHKDPTDEFIVMHNTIIKSGNMYLYQIDMLRFIEKFFMMLEKKHAELRITKPKKLEELEKKKEKERKNKYAQAQKNIVVDKIKLLEETLKKKAEKIVLPIRKVRNKLRPIEKHQKSNSMALGQRSQNIEEYFIH